MLKKLFYSILLTLTFFSASAFDNKHLVTDYHQTFIPGYDAEDKLQIAIRTYYFNGALHFLLVDPFTFSTKNVPATTFKSRRNLPDKPGYFTLNELEQTPYFKALKQYTSPPFNLENYGITRADYPVDGMFLTIDLCPSLKVFEEAFFKKLVALSVNNQHPTPIAISITGLWIIGHTAEFAWLIDQQKANHLQITWINHSFSHVYYHGLKIEDNFLLAAQTNIDEEILGTEKILLEHGQLPSVFFRFPGLVSNKNLITTLRKFSLVPIGSDAWLAKDESPKQGSFILVHGNSNEKKGIELIMPLLQQPHLHLLPLNQAFELPITSSY